MSTQKPLVGIIMGSASDLPIMQAAADILKKFGGQAGGIMIYNAAKASSTLVNYNKNYLRIFPDTMSRVKIFYPSLDLSRVRIVKNANLPANWIESPSKTTGMTFGWNVYSKKSDLEYDYDGLLLLIHELTHVQQMRNHGEAAFAARYGEEYLQYGYPDMPLEREAFEFVSNIPFDPAFYLHTHGDVNDAVKGSNMGAFAHWLDVGINEGRDSTPYFNSHKYLKKHDDLASAFGSNNFKAGVLHWMQHGKRENRKGN